MLVFKAPENTDDAPGPSVFLAGSIEMGAAEDWQTSLTEELSGVRGSIFNPRREDWDSTWKQVPSNKPFKEQVTWELQHMEKATVIAMYFDPATKSPITLLELGLHAHEGKVVVYCPPGYWRRGNVVIACERYGIHVEDSWNDFVGAIKERLMVREDEGGGTPVNNTGSGTDGAVAGLGGKDGEPPGPRAVLGTFRRKLPKMDTGLKKAIHESRTKVKDLFGEFQKTP